jgi:hypothetical protein
MRPFTIRVVLSFVLAALAAPAAAQQALLDQPVKAGELTLFPDLNDGSKFYYVSDKPRLSVDADGHPQFSFLRWVDDQKTNPDAPDAREGEGGGIVHAVVSLGVTPEQLQTARQELQRVRPGGTIQGPMVYRSGKFALVAAVTDPAGGLATKVLGLGKAPVLDGEKAAVSILLTKQGAKILWESFATPAPDISFSFEMELGGFRSPHKGVIEADFDQIYEHQAFGAGVASTYLAAEIKGAFDDLTRKNAIRVTQVGSDEKLESLLSTAYEKLLALMFAPIESSGVPSIASMQAIGGGPSLLDRAGTMLAAGRADARASAASTPATAPAATPTVTPASTRPAGPAGSTGPSGPSGPSGPAAEATAATPPADSRPQVPATARGSVTPPAETSPAAGARLAGDPAPATAGQPAQPAASSAPAFAVVATYEMKQVHQRGTFRIDLNKFTTDSLTLRFDENIGDLRSLRGDATVFRQVNLDDPFFRKREIAVALDGLDADDFGKFVNGVTVHLRKVHATGEITDEEVAIKRDNFTAGGNAFKLVYGWKNDADRRKWLDYEYTVTWSFFGGVQVAVPAQKASDGMIVLAPPFQRRTVEVQADPAALAAQQVRSITVRLWAKAGGKEQVQQVTLDPGKSRLSDRFEILLPADSFAYDYEIAWRKAGNKSGTTGRLSGQDAILFVDDVVL